jgi:hypothetical protein
LLFLTKMQETVTMRTLLIFWVPTNTMTAIQTFVWAEPLPLACIAALQTMFHGRRQGRHWLCHVHSAGESCASTQTTPPKGARTIRCSFTVLRLPQRAMLTAARDLQMHLQLPRRLKDQHLPP